MLNSALTGARWRGLSREDQQERAPITNNATPVHL